MKERPIIFSAPMVRAALAGTKSQTRRAVKPQPSADLLADFAEIRAARGHTRSTDAQSVADSFPCPYGQPGDRLWVRESWAAPHAYDHLCPRWIPHDARTHYAATEDHGGLMWRSPIFMPRWASRITIEITGIRVERLQDISHADAMAEGMALDDAIYDYSRLWESLNGSGSWDANPWVWIVAFKRVEGGAA